MNIRVLFYSFMFFVGWIFLSPSTWPSRFPVQYSNGTEVLPTASLWISWLFSPGSTGQDFRDWFIHNDHNLVIRYGVTLVVFFLLSTGIVRRHVDYRVFWISRRMFSGLGRKLFSPTEPKRSGNDVSQVAESFSPSVNGGNSHPVPSTNKGEDITKGKNLALRSPNPGEIIVFKNMTPTLSSGGKEEILKKFADCIGVPFPRVMVDLHHLEGIRIRLEQEFPWLLEATKSVFKGLEVQARLKGDKVPLQIRPVLLNGPPGTGKTEWARRLSELLGTEVRILTLGGKNSSMSIRSPERVWANAGPSILIGTILQTGFANPLFVLDELDKVATGAENGNVQDTLLQLLEPTSSTAVYDDFLEGTCDLSGLQYIATSNSVELMNEALLTRFQVVQVEAPKPEHVQAVTEGIVNRLARKWMVPAERLPLMDLSKDIQSLLAEGKNLRFINRFVEDAYAKRILR